MKDMNNQPTTTCASCGLKNAEKICENDEGKAGKGCPTLTHKDLLAKANQEYDKADIREFARQASIQEAECYANRDQRPYVLQPTKTRIVEICEFAKKMNYRRLGLAFCMGLASEAGVVEVIFKDHGFEVISAVCKAGRTSKDLIGLKDDEKVHQGTNESMCNPVYQANLLNEAAVELNVVLGLCVGHDSLFFKYAQAPITVLAVKDRVTGHNPLAAVYTYHSYHRKIKHPDLV